MPAPNPHRPRLQVPSGQQPHLFHLPVYPQLPFVDRKKGREGGREANWNGGGKKEAGRDEGGVPGPRQQNGASPPWGQRRPPTAHIPRCSLPSLAVFSHGWVPQVGRRRQRRAGQSPPPSEPHLEPLACVAPSEAASELCPTAAQYGEQDP